MYEYKVIGRAVNINCGVVEINEAQAKRRKRNIEQIGDTNRYKVLNPIMFKNGETFKHDMELPKAVVDDVTQLVNGKEVKPVPKKRATKKAADK